MSEDAAELTRAPRIAPLEWVRLFLSYQRYGMLLVSIGVGLVAGSWIAFHSIWISIGACLLAAWPLFFGMNVLARWPAKVRATRLADRRIASGRFDPRDVRPMCGDPCFRVVAKEVLVRAGVPRQERRRLLAELSAEVDRDNRTGVMVDHTRGIVTTVIDGQTTQHHFDSPASPTEASRVR